MLAAGLVNALLGIIYALWFVIGVYVYVALSRQISARGLVTPVDGVPAKTFGFPEAIVAAVLISFFLLTLWASISVSLPAARIDARALVGNLLLAIVVILGLIGFLRFRGLDLDALAGLSKIGILRTLATGVLLLLAAHPLITFADAISRRLIGDGAGPQTIVDAFNASGTLQQRILIIVLAVAVAPMAEEIVFRFFLYGVLRRYAGRLAGLLVTSLLFAAVHAHLPSFAPLFVLGCCFTLAYEWSGSILVSMTMHSFFNAATLTFLAFPGRFPQ